MTSSYCLCVYAQSRNTLECWERSKDLSQNRNDGSLKTNFAGQTLWLIELLAEPKKTDSECYRCILDIGTTHSGGFILITINRLVIQEVLFFNHTLALIRIFVWISTVKKCGAMLKLLLLLSMFSFLSFSWYISAQSDIIPFTLSCPN